MGHQKKVLCPKFKAVEPFGGIGQGQDRCIQLTAAYFVYQNRRLVFYQSQTQLRLLLVQHRQDFGQEVRADCRYDANTDGMTQGGLV